MPQFHLHVADTCPNLSTDELLHGVALAAEMIRAEKNQDERRSLIVSMFQYVECIAARGVEKIVSGAEK